jgi:hypothetical protein
MYRFFCDTCKKEVELNRDIYTICIKRKGQNPYFVEIDTCLDCVKKATSHLEIAFQLPQNTENLFRGNRIEDV